MSNMDETILCCNSIYILFIYFLKMNFRLIHLNLGITGPWSSSNSTTCQPLEIFSHGTSISLSHSLLALFFFFHNCLYIFFGICFVQFQVPAEVPDWNMVYKDATLPLMVDIGCGNGVNSNLCFCNLLIFYQLM